MKRFTVVGAACVLGVAACAGTLEDKGRFFPAVDDGGAPSAVAASPDAAAGPAACPDVPTAVFVATCGTAGCHDAPHTTSDDLDLVAPGVATRLVGAPAFEGGLLIDPNAPENSVLYKRLRAGAGPAMPPTGALDDATVACVLAWIEHVAPGAARDASAPAPPPDAADASPASTFAPIRVAAGATAAYTDHGGSAWSADTGFTGGDVDSRTNAVGGTTDAALYQSERWGTSFSYSFAVPAGTYDVTLKFAETYDGAFATGKRVFDVTLDGQPVLQSFDIFAEAGANTAVDKTFPVTVTGAAITLQFSGTAGAAKIDAIAITAKNP